MPYIFSAALRERLALNLRRFPYQPVEDPGLRQAAVMLIVAQLESAAEACILMTKRPAHLRRHANQFALPGGRLDAGETPTEAAIRETEEELGLVLTTQDVLGVLDDYPTRSGFRITPIVAWGGPALALNPDPNEVAHVFRIPLSELDDPSVPHLTETEPGSPPVLSAPLASIGDHIYSPTAAMLYQFREVAMNGRTTRVAHFDQPKFAWS